MSASDANTIRLKTRADGTVVRVLPDGSEEPFSVPEPAWARIDAMTDEDIERQIAEDPDVVPIVPDEQVERGLSAPRIRRLRQRLG